MSGIGTINDPYDLQSALSAAQPNDRYLLRGGTYEIGDGYSCMSGGSTQYPIKFIAYPGERVIFNRPLTLTGQSVWFYGVEFDNTGFTDRTSEIDGSEPGDINGRGLINPANSNNCKFILCHFRNGNSGAEDSATGAEWNGCLFYFNGWKSPTNSYGHGIYPQNNTPQKYIKNCTIFDNFGYGLHAWASGGQLNNFYVSRNTLFNNGSLWGAWFANLLVGGVDFDELDLIGNLTYYPDTTGASGHQIGYEDTVVTGVRVSDNLFCGGQYSLILKNVTIESMMNNQFYGALFGFASEDYSNNTYGSAGAFGDQQFVYPFDYVLIDRDGDGEKDDVATVGGIRPADGGTLTIYNQAQADTVQVDVSSVFDPDDVIKAHNVQDYFVDIQELTVAGDGTITVNMQAVNRTVATPVGWSAPATTFPDFGCFRLERQ